jgi:hypothetical protein
VDDSARKLRPDGIPVGRPFKPGESGNAAGRAKGRSLTSVLRELVEATKCGAKKLPNGQQVVDVLVEVVLKQALRGNLKAIELIWDRLEGKPLAPIRPEGKLTVEVVYTDIQADDTGGNGDERANGFPGLSLVSDDERSTSRDLGRQKAPSGLEETEDESIWAQ